MRMTSLSGIQHGLLIGLRVALVGFLITLLIRLATTSLSGYVEGVTLVYWGLAPCSLLMGWRLMPTEASLPASSTLLQRLSFVLPMILVAVILGTVLFVGYATNLRFPPTMISDELPQLYQILLARIAGLPCLVNVVVGVVGSILLAVAHFYREPSTHKKI